MRYLMWVVLFFVDLLSVVVGRLAAPIVVLAASKDGWLPKWLNWFQTPDNSLDGDSGHLERWPRSGWWGTYVRRMAWLWRNNMYNFGISVLGATVYPWDDVSMSGDPATSNRPLHNGTVKRMAGKKYFQVYYVKRWSSKYCIRINIGWKLWTATDARANGDYSTVNCQYVCSINPFMGWE